jgi:hypothetical protein
MTITILILCVVALLPIIPVILHRKRKQFTLWDNIYPFLGVPIWFVVAKMKIGNTASLSNMVFEVLVIASVSIFIPWLRWALIQFDYTTNKKAFLALSFIPMIVAIILRAIMPSMPE